MTYYRGAPCGDTIFLGITDVLPLKRRVHRVVNMGGVVKTLRHSNSQFFYRCSILSTEGSFRKGKINLRGGIFPSFKITPAVRVVARQSGISKPMVCQTYGNHENDENDEDNSDSYKQGFEYWIRGNHGNHGNDENHENHGFPNHRFPKPPV